MKRVRKYVLAAAAVGAAVLVFHYGRGPASTVPPGVWGDYTPGGLRDYRELRGGDPDRARDMFLEEAVRAGRAVEAYKSLPADEKAAGFVHLAAALDGWGLAKQLSDQNDQALNELLAVRAGEDLDDPWWTLFKARALTRKGLDLFAEPLYAQAVPRLADERKDVLTWRAWVACLVRLGRWEDAYQVARDRPFGFDCVADALLSSGTELITFESPVVWHHPPAANLAALRTLIDRHRPAEKPERRTADFYEGAYHFARAEYNPAAEAFANHLAAAQPGRPRVTRAIDGRVRALYRAGRFDEAKAAAADPRVRQTIIPRLWPVVFAAKAGDAEQVLRMVNDNAYLRAMPYDDPDLGPLLLSPNMAAVRAKYPPGRE